MLPSSTVENYLKAIFHGQTGLAAANGSHAALVPMGQVAASLGVTPGTATTMVKALAESGLAEYEPYTGVRLTPAGERLAVLVLRRHRLVELFLVQVMGMSWDEVHDDAEQLEHVVSERLIERIDQMLGRPTRGQTFRDRFLIADVRMDADLPVERRFWFDPPFHRHGSALMHRQPDNVWRIDFQLGFDADPVAEREPARVMARVRAMLRCTSAPWATTHSSCFFASSSLPASNASRASMSADSDA